MKKYFCELFSYYQASRFCCCNLLNLLIILNFYFKADYQLINNGKNLLVLPKSLKSLPNTIYEFRIESDYDSKTYFQTIAVQIDPKSVVPIVDLK